jgi:hypothetical protein
MEVIEIDDVDAQPEQRGVTASSDVGGIAAEDPIGVTPDRSMPNLVASTTSSRRSAIARR